MHIPTEVEFKKGCSEYEKHEPRDAMYKVASYLISNFRDSSHDITNGLGVLLLTWNNAFYRYGEFDFEKLEDCLKKNKPSIDSFNNRDIFSLSESDELNIKLLFENFNDALQINSGKKQGIKSPVAVAKALHILAPEFFPIWDAEIAKNYNCSYASNPTEKYIEFCYLTREIAEEVKNYNINSEKTILKLIDEYNYAKYTKKWI